MKKILVILGLSLLLSVSSISAQVVRLGDNTFFSIGGGVTLYGNDQSDVTHKLSTLDMGVPSLEFTFGKWMLNASAVRVGFNTFMAENEYSISQNTIGGSNPVGSKHIYFMGAYGDSSAMASSFYLTGHVDLMWDVITAFSGTNTNRTFSIYPVVGLGFVYRAKNMVSPRDFDFLALGGLSFDVNLYRNLNLFGEAKMYLFPVDYDDNAKVADVLDLTLGLKVDINKQQYRRRKVGETLFVADDWYLGAGAGANVSLPVQDAIAPGVSAELTVGKYFTTCASTRLQASGGLLTLDGASYTYGSLHADMMLDLLNFIEQYLTRKNNTATLGRGFSPMLYAGAGFINRFDNNKLLVGADVGVMFRFYLNPLSDLYLDMRYTMTPPRFMGDVITTNGSLSSGVPTFTFGYIRNLGLNTCR